MNPSWVSKNLQTRLIPDQAYRTAQEVILIFGANGTGEFFGYAKMIEPIDKEKAASRASHKTNFSSQSSHPATIEEERPPFLLTSSESRLASSSPGEISPGLDEIMRRGHRRTESPPAFDKISTDHLSIASAPARAWPRRTADSYFPPAAHLSADNAKRQEERGGSHRPQELDDNGVLRKDTVLTPEIKTEGDEAERGREFKIEWIKVGSLPFNRTRQYRNPWNQDREVKVSRDGTELEPGESMVSEIADDRRWCANVGRVG